MKGLLIFSLLLVASSAVENDSTNEELVGIVTSQVTNEENSSNQDNVNQQQQVATGSAQPQLRQRPASFQVYRPVLTPVFRHGSSSASSSVHNSNDNHLRQQQRVDQALQDVNGNVLVNQQQQQQQQQVLPLLQVVNPVPEPSLRIVPVSANVNAHAFGLHGGANFDAFNGNGNIVSAGAGLGFKPYQQYVYTRPVTTTTYTRPVNSYSSWPTTTTTYTTSPWYYARNNPVVQPTYTPYPVVPNNLVVPHLRTNYPVYSVPQHQLVQPQQHHQVLVPGGVVGRAQVQQHQVLQQQPFHQVVQQHQNVVPIPVLGRQQQQQQVLHQLPQEVVQQQPVFHTRPVYAF